MERLKGLGVLLSVFFIIALPFYSLKSGYAGNLEVEVAKINSKYSPIKLESVEEIEKVKVEDTVLIDTVMVQKEESEKIIFDEEIPLNNSTAAYVECENDVIQNVVVVDTIETVQLGKKVEYVNKTTEQEENERPSEIISYETFFDEEVPLIAAIDDRAVQEEMNAAFNVEYPTWILGEPQENVITPLKNNNDQLSINPMPSYVLDSNYSYIEDDFYENVQECEAIVDVVSVPETTLVDEDEVEIVYLYEYVEQNEQIEKSVKEKNDRVLKIVDSLMNKNENIILDEEVPLSNGNIDIESDPNIRVVYDVRDNTSYYELPIYTVRYENGIAYEDFTTFYME